MNNDSDVTYQPSDRDNDSDPDFELEEGKHFKQEIKWETTFTGLYSDHIQ